MANVNAAQAALAVEHAYAEFSRESKVDLPITPFAFNERASAVASANDAVVLIYDTLISNGFIDGVTALDKRFLLLAHAREIE